MTWKSRFGPALAAFLAAAALLAPAARAAADLPVTHLLEILRGGGHRIVYSDDVVTADMLVREPLPPAPGLDFARRELARHGLAFEARGDVLVVVRCAACRGSVRGRVLSAPGGTGLAGAVVTLHGPDERVARSGADGAFAFDELPAGRYVVRVEAGAFRPARAALDVPAAGGGPALLDIRLELEQELLEQVVVTPDRYDLAAEGFEDPARFGRGELRDTPLRAGESLSVVETLPGVAIGAEQASPGIRGTTGRDVLIVIDGLELYEPYHLPDFRSPFSLVDPEAIETLEVHTGGMSAEYGDRLGGLVRIETPSGPGDDPRAVAVGSSSSRLSWGGTLGRGGWWAASGRAWYPNSTWSTINVGDDDINPKLSDFRGKLQFRAGRRGILSLHLLGANDDLDFLAAENDEAAHASVSSRYAWARFTTPWGHGAASETVVGAGHVDRARGGWGAEHDGVSSRVRDERRMEFAAFTQRVSQRLGQRHVLHAGLELRRMAADYDYDASIDGQDGAPQTRIALRPSGSTLAAYASDRVRLGERTVLEIGLRWDEQRNPDDKQLSPRLNLAWRAGGRGVLRVSAGRYAQSQRIHELEVEHGVTEFARAQLADQLSAAWQGEFGGSGWSYRIGAYERRLHRLRPRWENAYNPVELFPEVERDLVRIDAARARARGIELSLDSRRAAAVALRASYTYSRAEDREDGRWVPRSWDQRHAAAALLSLRLFRRVSVGLAGYARSGWPTTPVGADIRGAARNSARFPHYYRLDAQLSWSGTWGRTRLRLDAGVTNLTDRKNVCCVDVSPAPETGALRAEHDPWTGIAPLVSASIAF
ncbi:MAG: TonB-dependent receptor [Acidobacteria bacterium]|nr:TonB-dependent receptor [Acidobacteriota bacterium]